MAMLTIKDTLDYRRWAASMFEEVKRAEKINCKQYYYLQEWMERFDRMFDALTTYPEHHVMYQRGFENLKRLCLSL